MKYELEIDWSGTGLWIGVTTPEDGVARKMYSHTDLPTTAEEWFREVINWDHERAIEAERNRK